MRYWGSVMKMEEGSLGMVGEGLETCQGTD